MTRQSPLLDSSSAVERLAVNEDVAGSKPAYPATIEMILCCVGFGLCCFASLAWGLT
jgi:hypothetical protein